eukprot:scaffold50802_cov63-Phaeocystis_antarctica.AAC.3
MNALQWLEQSAALAAARLNATDECWVATRQAAGRAAKKPWGHPPPHGIPQPWCGHQHYAPPHAWGHHHPPPHHPLPSSATDHIPVAQPATLPQPPPNPTPPEGRANSELANSEPVAVKPEGKRVFHPETARRELAKQLREVTGQSARLCEKALLSHSDDMQRAADWLLTTAERPAAAQAEAERAAAEWGAAGRAVAEWTAERMEAGRAEVLGEAAVAAEAEADALEWATADNCKGLSRTGGPSEVSEAAEVPDHYVCPITTEIMTDPVSTADGFTYEREAISEWLRTKDTSPRTGAKLESKTLIPNHLVRCVLRAFIEASSAPSTTSLQHAEVSRQALPSQHTDTITQARLMWLEAAAAL